jgi:ADP-ribose pyrophosphatase
MPKIKQLTSKLVYQNKWMKVLEDTIKRPSGRHGVYGVVEKPDFAVIAAIEEGHIHLVQQYRYPVKARYWEMPQGTWEREGEIDPLELAMGELQEETGLKAGNMLHVAHQYLAYGFCNQGYHVYLATDLIKAKNKLDPEEEDLITKKFTLDEFENMILRGDIKDATTVNAYGLLKLKGLL